MRRDLKVEASQVTGMFKSKIYEYGDCGDNGCPSDS